MPAWSPEIANEFIRLANEEERAFDQLQLQYLTYIAHGWCLAFHDQPLTGDRPEASDHGPLYRRLADALAPYGRGRFDRSSLAAGTFRNVKIGLEKFVQSDLDQFETDLIVEVHQYYGAFESWQLSALARKGDSPWKHVFAGGAGRDRDIPHDLVRAQFVKLLRQSDNSAESA